MLTATQKSPSGIRKPTLGSDIAERLREEIISGQLAPGSVVAEIPTALRLGVSRVPVREATLVLERDGLLVFDQRGRCRVRTLSPEDFEEIFEVRLVLECESFRLAASRRSEEDLVALERNIAKMARAKSLDKVTLLDIEFHNLILNAAGNSRLTRLWEIMRGQIQLFTASLQRQANEVTATVRETTVAAHHLCLDVIRSGNSERAVGVARQHMEAWRKYLASKSVVGVGK